MDNKPDIRLINPHPECHSRHHDDPAARDELPLVLFPERGVEPRMIGKRGDPHAAEKVRDRIHLTARDAVNDAGLPWVTLRDEGKKLPLHLPGAECHPIVNIRAVKARNENLRINQKPFRDFLLRRGIGRSGERDPGNGRETLFQKTERAVFRTEIVPPGHNAVRFINREKRDPRSLQHRDCPLVHKPLRGDVEKVECP